jgi:hypothetical protein
MNPPHPILSARRLLLLSLLVASALMLLGGGRSALAATYIHENQQAYEAQLAKDEIKSAVFNKRVRNLHLTLKDGTLYLYHYPAHEEEALVAALKAKGVPVTILTPAQANAQAKAPVHHKLRYIAGGILIVVIVVVGAVLLIDRRRKAAAE